MAEEEGKKESKNTGLILSLGFAIVNLALVGGGAYMVYAGTLGYVPPSVHEAELDAELNEFRKKLTSKPTLLNLGEFNTNLNGLPRRFVRVEVSLEMLDEEGFEEVFTKQAASKDLVVKLLNGKKFKQLETVQGKLHLKNQIITQVNGVLDNGVVQNVYFTKFAVQ